MVKLIVFDLDGTLIDSRLDLAGAVNHMRGTMGLEPLTADRVISFVGNGRAESGAPRRSPTPRWISTKRCGG